ncbi:MAG TPA: hypothetical protein VF011_17400 [Terriglobales bacterium]
MKQRIRSLQPNVTQDAAVQIFSSARAAGYLQRLTFGPLRYVADFYIPFRVFNVTIENRGTCTRRILALDAVTGALDIYCLDEFPLCTIERETRNSLASQLGKSDGLSIVQDKIRRLLFSKGFFRLAQLKIDAVETGELCVPYWVGFRDGGGEVHLSVMDAVRRTREGAKVRRLIHSHLLSTASVS